MCSQDIGNLGLSLGLMCYVLHHKHLVWIVQFTIHKQKVLHLPPYFTQFLQSTKLRLILDKLPTLLSLQERRMVFYVIASADIIKQDYQAGSPKFSFNNSVLQTLHVFSTRTVVVLKTFLQREFNILQHKIRSIFTLYGSTSKVLRRFLLLF